MTDSSVHKAYTTSHNLFCGSVKTPIHILWNDFDLNLSEWCEKRIVKNAW